MNTIEYAGLQLSLADVFPTATHYDLDEIMDSPVGYLILNGFKQSIADAIAGREAQLVAFHDRITGNDYPDNDVARAKAKAKDKAELAQWAERLGMSSESILDGNANTFAKSASRWLQSERLAAIIAGTVGVRSNGPRLAPLERAMRDFAEESIRTSLGKRKANQVNGYTDLKPDEALKALVDRFLEKHHDRCEAEAKRRLNAAADLADLDI